MALIKSVILSPFSPEFTSLIAYPTLSTSCFCNSSNLKYSSLSFVLGLDFDKNVFQNEKYLRPEELKYLKGDSTKIRTTLGWKPKYTFEELLDEMVEYWLNYYKK